MCMCIYTHIVKYYLILKNELAICNNIDGVGFPGGASGKEPTCQSGKYERCGFDPWVETIPWRKAWQIHSSILAWRIPGTEEPGRLRSIRWQRVRLN